MHDLLLAKSASQQEIHPIYLQKPTKSNPVTKTFPQKYTMEKLPPQPANMNLDPNLDPILSLL